VVATLYLLRSPARCGRPTPGVNEANTGGLIDFKTLELEGRVDELKKTIKKQRTPSREICREVKRAIAQARLLYR
jgi:hypothetical protein